MNGKVKRNLLRGAGIAAAVVGTYGAHDMYTEVTVPEHPSCIEVTAACEPSYQKHISQEWSQDLTKNMSLYFGSALLTGLGLATIAVVYIEQPLTNDHVN